MIEMYITPRGFLFRRGRVEVGTMPFDSLEIRKNEKATPEDEEDMRSYAGELYPGEVYRTGRGSDTVVLGPPKVYTHEVTLRAAGNPDFRQFSDIGPRKTVRCCGAEEAKKLVLHYQTYYDMGGGNCSKEHGVVYELPAKPGGRRKSVGRVWYNGRYVTHAEEKAINAEIEAKYGKIPATT